VGLEQHLVEEGVHGDVLLSDGLDVLVSVNASLVADSSEVVVVGLEKIPGLVVKISRVGNSVLIFGDNNSLVSTGSSQDQVHGDGCAGG